MLFSISISIILLAGTTHAEEHKDWHPEFAGFVSVAGGIFVISFPDMVSPDTPDGEKIGFNDVYGSKNGLSFGGEVGLGLADIGLFGVARYRIWKKTGQPIMADDASFYGAIEWSQRFMSFGVRYFLIKLTRSQSPLLPFVGGGMIHGEATESVCGVINFMGAVQDLTGEINVDGTGFYVECGSDLYVTPAITVRGLIEYSNLNLGISEVEAGAKTEGGGGVFAGISINVFVGRPMRSF